MKTKFTHLPFSILALFCFSTICSNAQQFVNDIRVPYIMPGPHFDIDIFSSSHNFDPNGFIDSADINENIATYCYNEIGNTGMRYLGPTLIFRKGETMSFNITNFLDPLPGVDTGANTTVHWHGLNVPALMDGGPHQVIQNDTTWSPTFPVIDSVQTLWYHTHLMDQTTDQVVRGLAGMIIVEDPDNDPHYSKLPQDYGINDIPIVIQEKYFIFDRTVSPPVALELKAGEKPGNGHFTLINGVVGGHRYVPREIVRLRILNGSPRKSFHIGLSTTHKNPAEFESMWLFATGGGYLDYPRESKSNLISAGDRREYLIDFSKLNHGDSVFMSNLPYPHDANYGDTPGDAFMAFIVDTTLQSFDPITEIPTSLVSYTLSPNPVFRTRTKKLQGGNPMPPMGGMPWTIDGTPMDMGVINDTVLVNTKERWVIENTTTKSHPFHIHKVQFQVTKYEGTLGIPDTMGVIKDTVGTWIHPNLPDELIGQKDVQLIRPGATLTFEADFDSFPSPLVIQDLNTHGFMYHCHILTHEDNSMMHQFVVVDSLPGFNLAANECGGAIDINPLFGGPLNEPQVSGLYNNTNYTSVNDPGDADDCHEDNDPLQLTIWYSFTSTDGATYGIRTVECNAIDYIDFGDTQMTIFEGDDCGNMTQVACNDDEDLGNDIYNAYIELPTSAGQTYYILVDGYDALNGEFCLEVTNLAPNDVSVLAKESLHLYPNPATNTINFNGPVIAPGELRFYDVSGKLLKQQEVASLSGTSVSVSDLLRGVILVEFMDGESSYQEKLVLK